MKDRVNISLYQKGYKVKSEKMEFIYFPILYKSTQKAQHHCIYSCKHISNMCEKLQHHHSSTNLFFGLIVLKSPVGEGPHLFKLFFLSIQHLTQVHNYLMEDNSSNKPVSLKKTNTVFLFSPLQTQICRTVSDRVNSVINS